jgi:hypothetical protein
MKSLIALAALAAFFAFPAIAQERCGPTHQAEQLLTTKYGEAIVDAQEIEHPNKPGLRIVVQVWANLETGTWTLMGRGLDGFSCLFGEGRNYEGQTVAFFLSSAT